MTIEFTAPPFDIPMYWSMHSGTVGSGATGWTGNARAGWLATEVLGQAIVPRKGIIRDLYVVTNTTQNVGGNFVITLRVNGVDQTLALTIAAGAVAGTFTDLTNQVVVAAGDLVVLRGVNNYAGTSAQFTTCGFMYRMARA